jgi:hypothetical protein
MFNKQPILLKAITFAFLCFSTFTIERYLYHASIKETVIVLQLAYVLVEFFVLMLYGFFFFQVFKYFRFPKSYYAIKKIETITLYHSLGVTNFQKILVNSFMRHANPRVYLKGHPRDYILTYYSETKQSESAHVIALFCTLYVQIELFLLGEIVLGIFLSCLSIFFNLYPVFLQRKNRILIEQKFSSILSPTTKEQEIH